MPDGILTCECGCGGEVKPGRRFLHGHNRRGVPQSPEARAKITGRPPSPDAGEHAIHSWLKRHHPKQGRCAECGREGKTDYAFQLHPEPYTRNIADYRELCRSCHFRLDESVIQRGPQLAASATSEQRRAFGLKGAEARWNTTDTP